MEFFQKNFRIPFFLAICTNNDHRQCVGSPGSSISRFWILVKMGIWTWAVMEPAHSYIYIYIYIYDARHEGRDQKHSISAYYSEKKAPLVQKWSFSSFFQYILPILHTNGIDTSIFLFSEENLKKSIFSSSIAPSTCRRATKSFPENDEKMMKKTHLSPILKNWIFFFATADGVPDPQNRIKYTLGNYK